MLLWMYNLRARYYLPRTGRFLTTDKYEGDDLPFCACFRSGIAVPTGGSHHLFGYSKQDPVTHVDPSGPLSWKQRGAIAAFAYSLNNVGGFGWTNPGVRHISAIAFCIINIGSALARGIGEIPNTSGNASQPVLDQISNCVRDLGNPSPVPPVNPIPPASPPNPPNG